MKNKKENTIGQLIHSLELLLIVNTMVENLTPSILWWFSGL